MPKYSVATPAEGQAAGLYVGAALTPQWTRSGASYQSAGRVYGAPGTVQVPAPPPGVAGGTLAGAVTGKHFSSEYAPNWFLPSVYYENDLPQDKEHAPVQFMDVDVFFNVMPKPAVRPANLLIADPYRAHVGGSQQIFQPQVVPVWMGRNGTTNG